VGLHLLRRRILGLCVVAVALPRRTAVFEHVDQVPVLPALAAQIAELIRLSSTGSTSTIG
jgi:hypothetical protein